MRVVREFAHQGLGVFSPLRLGDEAFGNGCLEGPSQRMESKRGHRARRVFHCIAPNGGGSTLTLSSTSAHTVASDSETMRPVAAAVHRLAPHVLRRT